MSTAPRYIARPHEEGSLVWNVWEHVDGSPIRLFVASTSDEKNAQKIAAALNMAQRIEFMAAALMTRPTMPTMDAGGEHGEVATEGPNAGFCSNSHCGWCNMQPTPEPAVGEAVRPAVEPNR